LFNIINQIFDNWWWIVQHLYAKSVDSFMMAPFWKCIRSNTTIYQKTWILWQSSLWAPSDYNIHI